MKNCRNIAFPGHKLLAFVLLLLVGVCPPAPAQAKEGAKKIVVFDFELVDTSGDVIPENIAAQEHRLQMISRQLREALNASPLYEVIDLAPYAEDIRNIRSPYNCNGCDLDFGQKIGADLTFIPTVQKVSNLILNINIYVNDVKNYGRLSSYSVDIRGNTDESWRHGVVWLLKHSIPN